MAPIFNIILLVVVAAVLLIGRLVVDMQKARQDALAAIEKLKETVGKAKVLAARVDNLPSHPQVEEFLAFLMKANEIERSLTERKDDLLGQESKLSYFKRLNANQHTWMKISHTADLFCKLTVSRTKSFELEAMVSSMTD